MKDIAVQIYAPLEGHFLLGGVGSDEMTSNECKHACTGQSKPSSQHPLLKRKCSPRVENSAPLMKIGQFFGQSALYSIYYTK